MALEPRHEQAIGMKLAGKSNPEIAKELGVDSSTVWRWFHENDEVRTELAKALQTSIEGGVSLLKSAYTRAARKLIQLVDSGDKNDVVQLRAALEVLNRVPAPIESAPRIEVSVSTPDPWSDDGNGEAS